MKKQRKREVIKKRDKLELDCGAYFLVEEVLERLLQLRGFDKNGGFGNPNSTHCNEGVEINIRRSTIPGLIKLLRRVYKAKWEESC